jgi:hypothetical protein
MAAPVVLLGLFLIWYHFSCLKWMAEAMGVSLKTEQRRSHTAVAGFGPWVRRAEGYREIRQIKRSGQVPVTSRRPPSLPLVCEGFPDLSSFFVLRETPMAFSWDNFKQLKCYLVGNQLSFCLAQRFPSEKMALQLIGRVK